MEKEKKELTWDDLWLEFQQTEEYKLTLAKDLLHKFWAWLTDNHHPPTKKEKN